MSTRNEDIKRKKTMKQRNKPWFIALAFEVVALIILGVLMAREYINSRFDKLDYHELSETVINDDMDDEVVEKMTGYTTIALFGVDSRSAKIDDDESTRSDSIIICCINNDTKDVKLVSVYRDSYLQLADENNTYEKVTHAYAYGGPQVAVNTLNKDLDLNITDYVTVNFTALTEVIDELGGLDIEVKEAELKKLNMSIREQYKVNGIYADEINTTGIIHMNGVQATAYARIRSTDQGDITRAWRQRSVISKMVDAVKSQGISKAMDCIDVCVDDISTSLSKDDIIKLAKACFDYNLSTTTGFPFTWNTITLPSKGDVVVPCDLANNVTELHRLLYNDMAYTPSETIKTISDNIIYETGYSNTLDLDTYTVDDDEDSICN